MVTKQGNLLIYDNLKLGWTKMEGDERIYAAFTDTDNEETHLFGLEPNKFEQFVNLGRQTLAEQKIEIATQMPPGGPPR